MANTEQVVKRGRGRPPKVKQQSVSDKVDTEVNLDQSLGEESAVIDSGNEVGGDPKVVEVAKKGRGRPKGSVNKTPKAKMSNKGKITNEIEDKDEDEELEEIAGETWKSTLGNCSTEANLDQSLGEELAVTESGIEDGGESKVEGQVVKKGRGRPKGSVNKTPKVKISNKSNEVEKDDVTEDENEESEESAGDTGKSMLGNCQTGVLAAVSVLGSSGEAKRRGRPPKKNVSEETIDAKSDEAVGEEKGVIDEEDITETKTTRKGQGRSSTLANNAGEEVTKVGKGRGRPPKKVSSISEVKETRLESKNKVEEVVVKSGKGRGRPRKMSVVEDEVEDEDAKIEQDLPVSTNGESGSGKGRGRGRPPKSGVGEPPKKRGRKPKSTAEDANESVEEDMDVGA